MTWITKPITFQFFIHLTSFVVSILVKFFSFTSRFEPKHEAKLVVPELATRDFEHCWWSLLHFTVSKVLQSTYLGISQPLIEWISKIAFWEKFALQIVLPPNTIAIYTMSGILYNNRKTHFETSHCQSSQFFAPLYFCRKWQRSRPSQNLR